MSVLRVAITLLYPLVVAGQAPRDSTRRPVAVLSGFVLRDDAAEEPIAGAEVVIASASLSARSDSTGRYRISDVPLGVHVITVRHIAHTALTTQLTFGHAETVERDFLLTRHRAVALDTIEVEAKPLVREFEERRRLGNGHFITRAQLEEREGRKMSDVLSQVPGLRVTRGLVGRAWISSGRERISINRESQLTRFERQLGARPGCYAHVYLDGTRVYGGREPLFDINSISPVEIEAIEYYSGLAQVPAQYNRPGSVCGVLVIWTRRQGNRVPG